MKFFLLFISILALSSCIQRQNKSSIPRFFPISSVDTTLDYTVFTITVPNSWKKPNDDTLIKFTDATLTGRIQIGYNEFIWYSIGLAASDWSRYPVIASPSDRKTYIKNNLDTSYIIFSDDIKSFDSSLLKIHKIWYGEISGYKTKFFEPKKTGHGYTGLYIDSTSEIIDVAKMNFAMFADKLDSNVNIAFVQAMKTIKYKGNTF